MVEWPDTKQCLKKPTGVAGTQEIVNSRRVQEILSRTTLSRPPPWELWRSEVVGRAFQTLQVDIARNSQKQKRSKGCFLRGKPTSTGGGIHCGRR